MQARDPKATGSKGPIGRPAFGIAPIARVAGQRSPTSPLEVPGLPPAAMRRPQQWRGLDRPIGFGVPNLRRNVCPHFYLTGSRGAIPVQAPHLLKAMIRQDQNISRCQLRGGVHMEQGFINDVCLTPRFNQCVFYEDDLTKE